MLTRFKYKVTEENSPISVSLVENKRITEDKVINSSEILHLYFMTNGTPGYIADFLMFNTFVNMQQVIVRQLRSAMLYIEQGQQFYATKADLAKSVHSLFYGTERQFHLVDMGLAYIKHDMCYLSHVQYLGLVYMVGYVPVTGDSNSFGRLEAVAEYIILTNPHCLSLSGLSLPIVTDRIVQKEIDTSFPDIGVVLVQLMPNHPAIDLLLIDYVNEHVYFIQCSYSKYHNHNTKYKHLKKLKMPDQTISVYNFYNKFKKHFYIYATFQPTTPRNEAVHIMSLRNFPEYFAVLQ